MGKVTPEDKEITGIRYYWKMCIFDKISRKWSKSKTRKHIGEASDFNCSKFSKLVLFKLRSAGQKLWWRSTGALWKYSSTLHGFSIYSLCFVCNLSFEGGTLISGRYSIPWHWQLLFDISTHGKQINHNRLTVIIL